MRDLTRAANVQAGPSNRRKAIAAMFAAALIVGGCSGPKGGGNGAAAGGGNPSKPGTTQKVLLVWKQASNSWKVKLNGGPEQDPKDALTNLPKGTGPTKFEVSINGGGQTPPTFSNDPLWVWEGQGQKSSPQNGIKSTQILGPTIDKHDTLIFWDLNQGDPVTLNYQFNFDGGIPPVDPIIDNGGHD